MVTSIKPYRDAIGLTDGQLLHRRRVAARRPAARPGPTCIRRPARRSRASRSPESKTSTAPCAPPAGLRRRAVAAQSRAKERIRVLRRTADLVREHGDELLRLQALDNSVPLTFGPRPTRCRWSASPTSSTTTPAGSTSSAARRCRLTRAATTWC